MRRVRYLASARSDLGDIQDYITQTSGSLAVGEKFAATLRAQCKKLAGLAGTLGRPRPEISADLRSFPFKGYIIFFRYRDDVFEVVNILEGHRDVGSAFPEEPG